MDFAESFDCFFEGSPFYWLVGYGLQDGIKLGLPFQWVVIMIM